VRQISLLIALSFLLFIPVGCGPSADEKKALETFNALEELIQKGGYVKKLDKFEQRSDRVFVIEAEIVDEKGVALGRLRSERIEGFATAKPRIQWYKTPGEPEEWAAPQWRGRRDGQGRGGNRPEGGERGSRGPRPEGAPRGPRGDGAPPPPPPPPAEAPANQEG
jgi:hypothetical protein